MINEATMVISAWLKGSTFGVNAALPGIPRKFPNGDDMDEPRPVTIYDDVQDEETIMELDPPDVPALVVFCDSEADIELGANKAVNATAQRAPNIVVIVAYIDRETPYAKMKQEGGLVLRAVRRSLTKFSVPSISNAARTLNNIRVDHVVRMREVRVTGAISKSTLIGFVRASLSVTDLSP